VGSDSSLEAVKEQHARSLRTAVNAVDFQKIAVGSIPALDAGRGLRLSAEELSPQCLQMTAGNPPRGGIDYLSGH
jgi:hypothetical protein